MIYTIPILLTNLFITFISANYTYVELHGDLRNEFNFSLFIKTFIGIVVYSVDSKSNKFLIELEVEANSQIVIMKFNKLSKAEKLENLCGCQYCFDAIMTFVIRLSQLEVISKCEGIVKLIKLTNFQHINQFVGFPLPPDHKNDTGKMSIWIGNIGFYTASGNIETKPLKNQLIGCLDKFYFNDQIVSFEQRGKWMSTQCSNVYNETVCNISTCTDKQISYGINDCSFLSMNFRYCRKTLPLYSETNNLYKIRKRAKFPISIRLEWKQFFLKNYCLIDFTINKIKSVMIYLNKMNQISFAIENSSFVILKRNIFAKVTEKTDNVLIIIFDGSQLMTRMAHANKIYTFIEPFNDRPVEMRIGKGGDRNLCQSFKGALGVYYDPIQINKPTSQGKFQLSKLHISFTLEITAFVLLLLIAVVLLVKFKVLPQFNKTEAVERQNQGDQQPNEINDYEFEDRGYAEIKI